MSSYSGCVFRATFTLSLFLLLLGDEMGMLEDACVSITNLTCVKFKVQVGLSILSKHEEIKGQSENRGSLKGLCWQELLFCYFRFKKS